MPPLSFRCRRIHPNVLRPSCGFTLLELLVSMAVAILLIVLLLQVFSTSTSNWQRGENQTDAFREARAALQIMSRDLSQTVSLPAIPAPIPGSTPASASLPTLALAWSPESSPASDYAFEQAYCLTALHNNGGLSDLCTVGYYCKWDSAKHAYVLMRQFANSDTTYNAIFAAHNNQPLLFTDLFSRRGNNPAVPTDLAAYVWDLEFRIDTSLKGIVTGPAPPPPKSNLSPGCVYGTDPPYPGAIPPFVEIRFKAMSVGAAKILNSSGNITQEVWTDPNNALYQRFILPVQQQFSARLPLINYSAATAITSTTPAPSPTP